MILAGIVGSIAVNIMPWERVSELQTSLPFWQLAMIAFGLAFFGVLLPSPMSFDVILASVFLQAGAPVLFVAILLFSLGTFSIFAFFVIWKSMSLRLASYLFMVTVLLSLIVGTCATYLEHMTGARVQEEMLSMSGHTTPVQRDLYNEKDYAQIKEKVSPVIFDEVKAFTASENIRIEQARFYDEIDSADKGFVRIKGPELGIVQPYEISSLSGLPDEVLRSTMAIASGDVHNDGWQDILVLGDPEITPNLHLYANVNGSYFEKQALYLPDREIIALGLLDLNADGWLDILYTTYDGETHRLLNVTGSFPADNHAPLTDKHAGTTASLSFSDFDKDGDVDIFLGNWSVGPVILNAPPSKNILLLNVEEEFMPVYLEGYTGETLTSLFHDFNDDGHTDLYVGNDFVAGPDSDILYLGSADGTLSPAPKDIMSGVIGAQSTMSIDTADINNDLQMDVYIGQIAFSGQYLRHMSKITDKQVSYEDYCKIDQSDVFDIEKCERQSLLKKALARSAHNIIDACDEIENLDDKKICLENLILIRPCQDFIDLRSLNLNGLDRFDPRYKNFCETRKNVWEEIGSIAIDQDPFVRDYARKSANQSLGNILLVKNENGYQEQADQRNASYGAWTWNARFADFDNDGWQDLYIVNGYTLPLTLATNLFYKNIGEGAFDDRTEEYSLTDFSPTSAFTIFDMDHDGDLDLVNNLTDADVRIYQNAFSGHYSIGFELRDYKSNNRFSIGARVQIDYEDAQGNKKKQLGIIKGSGGFRSFNPYQVFFGLGSVNKIEQITIHWPDGKIDFIQGQIQAGSLYRITRE
jgi:hypothetical protein